MLTTTDEPFVTTRPETIAILEAVNRCAPRPTPPQPGPSLIEQWDNLLLRKYGITRAEGLEWFEAKRQEVHPEWVKFDDCWEGLIADWESAHPIPSSRGFRSDHDGGLRNAAASARVSGDARDLGEWFSTLKLWSGSRTRSERFKSETVKGSDKPSHETPEQTEQRYKKWLAAVRNGKARQKEATCSRRWKRQREREEEAVRTGGSVRESKSGRKTVLTREAREVRARNIESYNRTRLSDKRPATVNLPHIKHKKRSSCEEKVIGFVLDELFPDIDVLYSEARPDRVSEIGCTWRGNLFPWERDIDVLFNDGGIEHEFQIQTKGTGFWYILLRRAIKETGTPCGYQPKALEELLRILTTIGIRSMLGGIQETCKTDGRRPLLFCSSRSVHTWVKSKHTYDRSAELLDLFAREDIRFRRYFWKFFKTVFPREVAILRAAETRLRDELTAMGNPKVTAQEVAEGFSICLADAKAQAGYTDDRAQLATRYRQLRYDSKIRKQVLKDLPSWFRATPVVPKDQKRDKKGKFRR